MFTLTLRWSRSKATATQQTFLGCRRSEGRKGVVINFGERFQNVAMAPTSTHQSFPHRERAAEMGVKLALDDFGKGESNLDRLVSYPVQIVKLDRSLCLRVADSRKARTVIKSTQQICEDLGITLIAEGIETQTHHETLLELGVGIHQGFYHHRPMAKAGCLSFSINKRRRPHKTNSWRSL